MTGAGGVEIVLDLLGGAEFEADRRSPYATPQTIGDATELLLDGGLLQQRQAEAAMFLAVIDAGETPGAHLILHSIAPVHRQFAVLVGDLLEGDENFVAEVAAEGGKLLEPGREFEIH